MDHGDRNLPVLRYYLRMGFGRTEVVGACYAFGWSNLGGVMDNGGLGGTRID